jgi:ATP-independent RNA helicase DbpA
MFQKGALLKEEFGLIEVKEQFSLVAVKANLIKDLIKRISGQKIKGQKTKFEIAK